MPSARPGPIIGQAKDGSIIIQYQPKETGVHEMNLSYNDKPTDGQYSPAEKSVIRNVKICRLPVLPLEVEVTYRFLHF